mgnify:CR=1 FL=1
MRIIYFSLGYCTHDYRFLKSISDGGHEVFFVQLEGNQRQVESRPVPENVNMVIWKGGKPTALIDGRLVAEGSVIENKTLTKIESDGVWFVEDGVRYYLTLEKRT